MTLPALATVVDLENRLGDTVPNHLQALALLAYASALVRSHTGKTFVDTDGNLLDPLPDGLTQVTVEMVFRAVTNPTGATQETTGPFSISFGSAAAQRIYLTAADKSILGAKGRGGLQVISTTRGDIETRSVIPGAD